MTHLLNNEELRNELERIFHKDVISEEPYLSKGWSLHGIDSLIDLINQQKLAHAEAVIDHNTATYHDHPFLSDYAMANIHITVNDMMLYDKTQHFDEKTRKWFEDTINSIIDKQLQVKCDNTLRDKLRQRNKLLTSKEIE